VSTPNPYPEAGFDTLEDAAEAFGELPVEIQHALVISVVDDVTRVMERKFGALDAVIKLVPVGDIGAKLDAVRDATEALIREVATVCNCPLEEG